MQELFARLFSEQDAPLVSDLYSDSVKTDDESSIRAILAVAANRLRKEETVVKVSLLDFLFLTCIESQFSSLEEARTVAVFVSKAAKAPEPLPDLSRDFGLNLAAKTLVALSLYSTRLENRYHRRGAPAPATYRTYSISILSRQEEAALRGIGEHHLLWESYLAERLL